MNILLSIFNNYRSSPADAGRGHPYSFWYRPGRRVYTPPESTFEKGGRHKPIT